jgi:hypothetical protein
MEVIVAAVVYAESLLVLDLVLVSSSLAATEPGLGPAAE